MKIKIGESVRTLALGTLAITLATGCQTYSTQNKKSGDLWTQGQVKAAAAEFAAKATKEKDSKDTVIWRLEEGAALRADNQFKESNTALEAAEEKVNKFDEGAKVKVGSEAVALLSNLANLPYEGRAYDKIMLNTYKALNYLQLGEPDKARVEFTRSLQRQEEAVEINKARVEKAEAAAAKDEKGKAAADKARENPKLQSQLDSKFAFLDKWQAEAIYKNPAALYLHGLFFMATATVPADLELAKTSFDQVAAMTKENKFVQQDQETVKEALAGKALPSTTYVIFETGNAPARGEIRIDLPLMIVGVKSVSYVGAAFPTLKPQDGHLSHLEVAAGETKETTRLLANMDAIIGREFKDELPVIITKTMVITLAKAVKTYFTNKAAKEAGGGWAELGSMLGNALYDAGTNIADTRTWTTLPKEFQVCRVPTPADRKLQLGDGQLKTEVTVEAGTINLIYVKAINTSSPLIVSQIKLK